MTIDTAPALKALNAQRAKHGAPPLKLDPKLAAYAQAHADKGVFAHSKGPHGENMALNWAATPAAACVDSVNLWYAELPKYSFAKPGFGMETGHFTANVWKSTARVGFGVAKMVCGDYKGAWLIVASFDPPGNMQGAFPANVLPAKK
ncbi:hypothetical protein WJX72_012512 [[Myrmecia] bisecta]|uniref:SCP domain-containing protein n=1 Tax=[Myrmecia] bisecta TaxID=41462 RepID=A0AAW1PXH9_9CHLO